MSGPHILVFTDLDGTLLDSRTYSFKPARPALRLLRERGIPLIICTSKPRAEVEPLRETLQISDPFIVENGGAVFFPAGRLPAGYSGAKKVQGYEIIEMGTSYDRILAVFSELKRRFPGRLRGFSDMDVEEVARLSGLSREDAARAKEREYDEPFVLADPAADLEAIRGIAASAGLTIARARFFHLTGPNDKGKAVRLVKDVYTQADGVAPRTIGLGDSPNDLPLLENVDFPVLVQKPGGGYEPAVRLPNLIFASAEGPVGWNEAVCELVERLAG